MRKFVKPARAASAAEGKSAGHQGESEKESAGLLKENHSLSPDLQTNLTQVKEILEGCSDIIYRQFLFAQREDIRVALIYTDGLVDEKQLSDQIMRTLALDAPVAVAGAEITKARAYHLIKERCLCVHQVKETGRLEEVIEAVLSGDAALLVDGHPCAILNGVRGWESRKITEPETEMMVRGPRESFVETLRTNTALIRRKIKNPELKIESMKLGRVTKTDIAVVYIKGIADDKLVEEVKKRLLRIDIDGVLESGYIEELIEDNPRSLFPQVNHTERPERLAARLMEGRVAILVDGTPFVLTVPCSFFEYLHASEDYYERYPIATASRLIRFLAMFLSLMAPSFYVAIVTFHQEMLPTAQRETVPFPVFVEALAMEVSFEILREAGLRLPRQVGQAVSIVGALIIGEAAVRAGLVAPATVIVVALTGISSFIFFYSASIATRLLRFPLMILSATMGLFGLIMGVMGIVVHLCTLRSFGMPYLSPVIPMSSGDLKDLIVRAPWWAMDARPRLIGWKKLQRQEPGQKPAPPETGPGGKGGGGSAGRG